MKYGYWTKERCQEESLKYITKIDFRNNSKPAYMKSLRSGWLNEICSHMNIKETKPKEKCQEEALKYEYRKKFRMFNGSAYIAAHRNKWLDEICSHMEYLGKWSIYNKK